jgi:tRNA threonylcarbamoyladenosine biosynthesis protein TsaB
MSYILNIDTAQELASVSLSQNGVCLGVLQNEIQQDHARFLHPAIKQLLNSNKIELENLSAVAVTGGPGSYTGLRVGMAAAKGICHALDLPLISLCTLKTMANAVKRIATERGALICPMIDARRMEVFTAVFNHHLDSLVEPLAMILEEQSFANQLQSNPILFFGSGANKFEAKITNPNAIFLTQLQWVDSMCELSFEALKQKRFSDLATLSPNYIKEYQA